MDGKRTKNVLLLCLTLYKSEKQWNYTYDYKDKLECPLDGFTSNEPHVKRLLEKLKIDGKKLDEVVILCSPEAYKSIENGFTGKRGSTTAFSKELKALYGNEDINFLMKTVPHYQHFENVVKDYALKTSREDYEPIEDTLKFTCIRVEDFLKEADIARAVTESANEVLAGGYDSIDLYVDFNGGPRIVMLLVMLLCNLLEARNVNVVEMTYVEAERRQPVIGKDNVERLPIQNMEAISRCMDLVEGTSEFINYGRIRTLAKYFEPCNNQAIQDILHKLETMTNNMQLCLTDYMMEYRESVAESLENWQNSHQEKEEDDQRNVFEIMFSFVAEDILNGCHDLLYGNLPEMVLWCVDRDFMQQALFLYAREMPEYFCKSGIFGPSDQEWMEYTLWQDEKQLDHKSRGVKIYNQWMNVYLTDIHPPVETDQEIPVSVSPESLDVYDFVQDTDGFLNKALQKAEACLEGIRQGRIKSDREPDDLRQILVEYQLIQRQYEGTISMPGFAEKGNLWNFYDEMKKVLRQSALRISGKAEISKNT